MIPRYLIRSSIFNLCYYILIAISCIALLPTLILPRRFFLGVVHYFVHTTAFLERTILSLKFEIRGAEHLPEDNRYIVAAKHQSAFETTKLHILFQDPAIVLKRELLKIPLWGWYLAKSDVIAIDRSSPKAAIESIKSEAQRVAAQNRPIVIFPQGTRVAPTTTPQAKPYKVGIVRMQEATGLPIIPMALNTGTFYPKNSWIKRPGTVVFEFLKPIEYIEDTTPNETLQKIEMRVEEASSRLREEAKKNAPPHKKKTGLIAVSALIFLCLAWTANWFIAAHFTKQTVTNAITDLRANPGFTNTNMSDPVIKGFPGKIKLSMDELTIHTKHGNTNVHAITAQSWPFLGMPIDIQTQEIQLLQNHWNAPLTFDSLIAKLTHSGNTLTIHHAELKHNQSRAEISGTLQEPKDKPYPIMDFDIALFGHETFLQKLAQKNIIKKKAVFIATLALSALVEDGAARTKITSDENKLYLGPIKFFEFPMAQRLDNGETSGIAIRRRRP